MNGKLPTSLDGVTVSIGGKPAYLSTESAGERTTVATEALWWPPGKMVGRYLTPFLAEKANVTLTPLADANEALPIEIELEAHHAVAAAS